MQPLRPLRGEIWWVRFPKRSQVAGHEQAEERPALIVSADFVNQSASDMVVVLPISTTERRIRSHVPIMPPEGGLIDPSDIKCEQIRAMSVQRLVRPLGLVTDQTMAQVEHMLKMVLELT
jgi:mRNA interferase MazF